MKNCQEMWLLYFFKNIEKCGVRTITGDTHESGNKRACEFQPDSKKSW
jgi:hypothetical protein